MARGGNNNSGKRGGRGGGAGNNNNNNGQTKPQQQKPKEEALNNTQKQKQQQQTAPAKKQNTTTANNNSNKNSKAKTRQEEEEALLAAFEQQQLQLAATSKSKNKKDKNGGAAASGAQNQKSQQKQQQTTNKNSNNNNNNNNNNSKGKNQQPQQNDEETSGARQNRNDRKNDKTVNKRRQEEGALPPHPPSPDDSAVIQQKEQQQQQKQNQKQKQQENAPAVDATKKNIKKQQQQQQPSVVVSPPSEAVVPRSLTKANLESHNQKHKDVEELSFEEKAKLLLVRNNNNNIDGDDDNDISNNKISKLRTAGVLALELPSHEEALRIEMEEEEEHGEEGEEGEHDDGFYHYENKYSRHPTQRRVRYNLDGDEEEEVEEEEEEEEEAAAAEEEEEESDAATGSDFSNCANERAREYRKGGYHPVQLGEVYNNRYRIAHKLGWGYFSTVWLVWDYTEQAFRAMKIQKSSKNYREAAYDEIKLLNEIMEADPHNRMCCTRLCETFEHRGPNGLHVCMVFELLGENVLKLIERYENRGIPLPIVKSICRQTLIGLHHVHSIQIIHTDIKPENVLLSHPKHKIFSIMKKFKPPPLNERIPIEERDPRTMTKSQRKRYYKLIKERRAKREAEREGELKKATGGGDGSNDDNTSDDDDDDEDEDDDNENDDEFDEPIPKKKNKNKKNNNKGKKNKSKKEDKNNFIIQEPEHEDGVDSDTDPEWDVQRFHNVRVADFGNSCWTYRQFTDEVQTRQYRAPEVIIGCGYDTKIDIFSAACMFFELLTGEFLFDPKGSDDYSREEDHLALMSEMLGMVPKHMATNPRALYKDDLFNEDGSFLHIDQLHPVSLAELLNRRFRFTPKKAQEIADFLMPMLQMDPNERASALDMLTNFEDFFQVQEDDFAPLCYVERNEDEEGDEEEDQTDDDDENLDDDDDDNEQRRRRNNKHRRRDYEVDQMIDEDFGSDDSLNEYEDFGEESEEGEEDEDDHSSLFFSSDDEGEEERVERIRASKQGRNRKQVNPTFARFDQQEIIAWLQLKKSLFPERLAEYNVTLDDIAHALRGGEPETQEKREAVANVLVYLQAEEEEEENKRSRHVVERVMYGRGGGGGAKHRHGAGNGDDLEEEDEEQRYADEEEEISDINNTGSQNGAFVPASGTSKKNGGEKNNKPKHVDPMNNNNAQQEEE